MSALHTLKKLAFAGLLMPAFVQAEDIDLFKGGATTGNKPNIIVFVDNSANWNSNAQHWPGGVKQGQSELSALKSVVAGLTSDVRVGLMFFASGSGSNPDGGYVRFGVRDMDTTNKAALVDLLNGMHPNFNDQNSGQQVASANTKYGEGMYEVFKYLSGSTPYAGSNAALRDYAGNGSPTVAPYTAGSITGNALSGATATNYTSPLSSTALCAKNYLIFIGNGFPSSSSAAPSTYGDEALSSFDASQIYVEKAGTTTYADEWARFLYKYGAAPASCSGCNGTVVTYTIDVYLDAQDQNETSLLKSMAGVGGGKYFAATSESQIEAALQAIINEVQAVNSVFSSASLPVSVNTQGTYLNQIYMGVFRPDVGGAPRWLGNLKQYKFGLRTDAQGQDELFLADAQGTAAVNTQTGFISPNAQSFWTTAIAPACSSDATKGFWCHSPNGVGTDKDLPDGDLIEKGAAAQKLRALGPAARTMYTCTPSCTSGATPLLWASTNNDLLTALGSSGSSITSLTRSGPTVTVTTASSLGLASPTDTVTLSATNVPAYNSQWVVTPAAAADTFTFTIPETPATPIESSGITAAGGAAISQSVAAGAMTMDASTHVVTVNLPAHGFTNGQTVTVAGADVSAGMATATTQCTGYPATANCEYNGNFTISVIDANNFKYTPPASNFGSNSTTSTSYNPPETFSSVFGAVALSCRKGAGSTTYTLPITAMTRTAGSGTQEVTVTADAPSLGDCSTSLTVGTGQGNITSFVVGSGNPDNGISGTYALTNSGAIGSNSAGSKTFKFNVSVTSSTVLTGTTTVAVASPATGTISAAGLPTKTVTRLERTAGNLATVTVTTDGNHGFASGSSVAVNGAPKNSDGSTSQYNGTFTISNASGNTFQYTLATGPTTSATGGSAAKGSGVDPTTLIDWVRGKDNKDDENINGLLTDVRASIHGDVLHSRPVVINYGGTTGVYAFYGANDGALHAVKGGQATTDGTEAWSFVAPEHYTKLSRLYLNTPVIKFPTTPMTLVPTPTKRDYFFDGNIGVFQSADLATTHIFVSMRRGGRAIYAFDVSSPTAPKFLWKRNYADTDYSELGQSWSEPKVVPIRKTAGVACNASDASTYTRALVFGAGYDSTQEDKDAGTLRAPTIGRGVFVVNAANGNRIKLLTAPTTAIAGVANSTKRYSIPSDVSVLDTNFDGCVDRLYVGDTGGNLLRFDIDDADSTNWKAYKIAALGDIDNDGGSDDRKFLFAPDTVYGYIGSTQIAYVMIGSGDREQPRATAVADKFFMIKDTTPLGTDPATVTTTKLSDLSATGASLDPTAEAVKGWVLNYETGEKTVNAPLTVAGITFFGTNRPLTAAEIAARNSCSPDLGLARGYAVKYGNGTAAYARGLYSTFVGGGLPPSPVAGVVQLDDGKTVRFTIGTGGDGTEGTVPEGEKLQANPSSRRQRAFWYFKKDD